MEKLERRLLENIFDSLDRLFDRECIVQDTYSLLFATDLALKEYNTKLYLSEYVLELDKVLKMNSLYEVKREEALTITDKLRFELSDLLDN